MNNVKVKICGIRSLESAQVAINAGADFLGFNFVKSSKRYIEPERAKEIINVIARSRQLTETKQSRHEKIDIGSETIGIASGRNIDLRNDVAMVGVFQNQLVDEVNKIAEELNLDYVQLHGEEDEFYIQKFIRPVIKKINSKYFLSLKGNFELRIKNLGIKTIIHNSEFLILDREVQGQGDMVDLDQAVKIADAYSIFIAGGLTPENVASVVKKVKPFAVDVAAGIETNGKEDREKIKRFIYNAKK